MGLVSQNDSHMDQPRVQPASAIDFHQASRQSTRLTIVSQNVIASHSCHPFLESFSRAFRDIYIYEFMYLDFE